MIKMDGSMERWMDAWMIDGWNDRPTTLSLPTIVYIHQHYYSSDTVS